LEFSDWLVCHRRAFSLPDVPAKGNWSQHRPESKKNELEVLTPWCGIFIYLKINVRKKFEKKLKMEFSLSPKWVLLISYAGILLLLLSLGSLSRSIYRILAYKEREMNYPKTQTNDEDCIDPANQLVKARDSLSPPPKSPYSIKENSIAFMESRVQALETQLYSLSVKVAELLSPSKKTTTAHVPPPPPPPPPPAMNSSSGSVQAKILKDNKEQSKGKTNVSPAAIEEPSMTDVLKELVKVQKNVYQMIRYLSACL
jgi:hypothetical protein